MPEHILPKGKRIISALVELGRLLGYHAEREFPVEAATHGVPPAVDVAWFGTRGDQFPLMIFEVESGASNTIANNALKVLAQDTSNFQKPLFFFHLVASGGSETARIKNLERQYGTHNYRIYKLGVDGGTPLLSDVLRQHARIRHTIDCVALYRLLRGPAWAGLTDPPATLQIACSLAFSANSHLSTYLRLARDHSELLDPLTQLISRTEADGWDEVQSLDAFLGHTAGPPVLCALMMRLARDPSERSRWDDALVHLEGAGHAMPSSLGCSREDDDFVVGVLPPLVVAIVACSKHRGKYIDSLTSILSTLLADLQENWHALFAGLWTCHLAAWLQDEALFESGRRAINEHGGVPTTSLMNPPASSSIECELEEVIPDGAREPCPPMAVFRTTAIEQYSARPWDGTQLALAILDEDPFFYEWTQPILGALWSE